MTETEIKMKCFEEVYNRVTAAAEKISGWNKCQEVFDDMTRQGYESEMIGFRNLVLYTVMLHPTWTEDEVIASIYEDLNKSSMA